MKKRLISIFALVIVVAMVASLAVGCSFFQENDYRVANETYVTVNHPNGVTLTISYNELLDYCNSNSRLYSYVNYYGLSVGEALDLCLQGKIQATYLLAEQMGYLTDKNKTSQARVDALVGGGAKERAEQVLTFAERYLAIYTVNESIKSSLDTFIEEAKADEWSREYKKIASENVKEIVLTEETLSYLKKFFDNGEGCLIGADLDESKIVAKVIYDDDSESQEFVVPSEGYSVAFTSEKTSNYTARTEEKNFTVKFTETKEGEDGEIEEIEHTYVYDYTLVYPRDVKAEEEEETDYSVVTIDEVEVPRYAKENEIPEAVKAQPLNLEEKYQSLLTNGGDKYEIEAYRLLIDNIKNNNRDMDYFYKSQFEAQASNSFNAEVYLNADASFNSKTEADLNARIVKEFKYLYEKQKNGYHGKKDDEIKSAFISAVSSTGTGMDTLYYRPQVVDLSSYFFVKQVLFKFDTDVINFLESIRANDEEVEKACEYFMNTEKVLASNPDYDADFDCPKHELMEDGAECAHGENEGLCPSIAFAESEEVIADVIARMQSELGALYAEQKYDEAYELFEKYLYSYCDDAGSFNADWGYLIAPEKDDNSWVENFTELAGNIYSYNTNVGNAFVADGEIGVSFTYSLSGTASSDYAGVSVMMVAKTPFIGENGDELVFANDDEIISYLQSTFNGKGVSLYDTLKKNIRDEERSLAYNDYIKIVPQDVYERDEENNKITANKDYKGVIEINTKKLKKNIYDQYLGK